MRAIRFAGATATSIRGLRASILSNRALSVLPRRATYPRPPPSLVSVPVGVLRGFRNVGERHAYLMAILGGTDAGKVG